MHPASMSLHRTQSPRPPTIMSVSSSAERFEHSYSLDRRGHKWLSMFVTSRSRSSMSAPVYIEGDTINGRVELDLDRPETIKGVVVAVQASVIAVGEEEFQFLNMEETLWQPGTHQKDKLWGRYMWPFTFTLPVTVDTSRGQTSTHGLPPNFSEKACSTYIDYKFIVNVKRGAFKPNQTLSSYFVYKPISSPPPPSPRRELAYRSGRALPGPADDPDGWKVYPPARIKGLLFNGRKACVDCTLAIATPLSYAVRSPIPLALMIASVDEQALELLAKPTAIRVVLVRHLAAGSATDSGGSKSRGGGVFRSVVGRATFWSSREGSNTEGGTRFLQGELEVDGSLKPSFSFPRLSVTVREVFLRLFPS
ncbi:hypothetical protein Moror_3907 [Moniliophthora roreri MCA 2997]|uniref:Arrestin-like N-terminal domain-containing protein n=1 Tax=Moniliophthora roreri (strain MCA 2997) TaxID=1381753 RepID=V2XS12_MONRO|nr:hypothetical protein Moror_3907 [Moniliophthora roreri MCA 2997]